MFPTTHRSMVLALGSAVAEERRDAFDAIVAVYWRPVYKYLRVRGGVTPEDAEDLAQGFFARAFEKESLAAYDPARASFRVFLRLLLDRHCANARKHARREKRGGGRDHLSVEQAEEEIRRESSSTTRTPEEYFHQEWVRSVLAVAVERLREACRESGRQVQYRLFEAYDLDPEEGISYRELASRFAIPETSVTNHLSSVRKQFREVLRETLREITGSESEYRAEVRALLEKP